MILSPTLTLWRIMAGEERGFIGLSQLQPHDATPSAPHTPAASYAYKASLIGSAHRFELTDQGMSWQAGSRSGVWPYLDIAYPPDVPARVDAVAALSRRY